MDIYLILLIIVVILFILTHLLYTSYVFNISGLSLTAYKIQEMCNNKPLESETLRSALYNSFKKRSGTVKAIYGFSIITIIVASTLLTVLLFRVIKNISEISATEKDIQEQISGFKATVYSERQQILNAPLVGSFYRFLYNYHRSPILQQSLFSILVLIGVIICSSLDLAGVVNINKESQQVVGAYSVIFDQINQILEGQVGTSIINGLNNPQVLKNMTPQMNGLVNRIKTRVWSQNPNANLRNITQSNVINYLSFTPDSPDVATLFMPEITDWSSYDDIPSPLNESMLYQISKGGLLLNIPYSVLIYTIYNCISVYVKPPIEGTTINYNKMSDNLKTVLQELSSADTINDGSDKAFYLFTLIVTDLNSLASSTNDTIHNYNAQYNAYMTSIMEELYSEPSFTKSYLSALLQDAKANPANKTTDYNTVASFIVPRDSSNASDFNQVGPTINDISGLTFNNIKYMMISVSIGLMFIMYFLFHLLYKAGFIRHIVIIVFILLILTLVITWLNGNKTQ